MASKPITIEITGDAKGLKDAVKASDAQLKRLGDITKKAMLGLGGLGAGAAVGLAAIGQSFDDAKNIIIAGTGASGDALVGLQEDLKSVMSASSFGADEIATALADVNTFFAATGAEAQGLTDLILDMTKVTGTETTVLTSGISGVAKQFGLTNRELDELGGDIIRISQGTGTGVEEMLATVSKFGPVLTQIGLTAEQSLGLVGAIKRAGLETEPLMAGISAFAATVAKEGKEPREEMLALSEAITGAASEAEAMAIASEAVGEQGAGMAKALRDGSISLTDFSGVMGTGAGVADEQAEAMMTLKDELNELKNKALVKVEPYARQLFETLKKGGRWANDNVIPAVKRLTEETRRFGDWVRKNKDFIIGGLAGFGTAVAIFVVPAFVTWAIAAGAAAIATLLAAAPVIALGVALTALGVGIVWLWKNWDQVWAKIKDVTGRVVDWIVRKWDATISNIRTGMRIIKDKIVGAWDAAIGAIKTGASKLLHWIVDPIAAAPGKIKDLAGRLLDAGKSVGSSIINGVKRGLSATGGFVGDVASKLWRAMKDAVNRNVVDKINKAIPNEIGSGFFKIDLPDNPVPRLFTGTGVGGHSGGLAMVGEQGRELVQLPRGSQVLGNRDTEAVLRPTQDFSVTINATTSADPHDIAREIRWMMLTTGGR